MLLQNSGRQKVNNKKISHKFTNFIYFIRELVAKLFWKLRLKNLLSDGFDILCFSHRVIM